MARPILPAVAFALVLLAPALTVAQEDRARATPIFEEGVQLAQDGDWEQALTRFEEAVALYAHPNIRLNLAAAQAETGRLLESIETYEALLEELRGISRRRRRRRRLPDPDTVSTALDQVRERVPRLTVTVPDAEAGDVVRLDAAARDIAAFAEPLQLNPGSHTLEWVRAGEVVGRETVVLEESAESSVTLTAFPPEEVRDEPDPTPSPSDGGGGGDELMVAGIALIGGGVAALGGMGLMMGLLDGLNGDASLLAYRNAIPFGTMACAEAESGDDHGLGEDTRQGVLGVCSDGSLFEILQYVLMGTGIAAAGAGLALIILDATSTDDGSSARLVPRVSPTYAGIEILGEL